MAPRSVARTVSLALCALLVSCKREIPRLDPMQKMTYEAKPSIVRVNAVATARLHLDSHSVEAVREGWFAGAAKASPDSLDVDTGAGGSGSGFVVHPSGTIVTASSVVEPTRDEAALRRELTRNGAIAFLLRAFSATAVRELAKDERLEECVAAVTSGSTLDSIRITNEVELSNGRRVPFYVRRSDGGSSIAILQVKGSNLPAAKLATHAPALQQRVWIAGYPSIAAPADPVAGGWSSLESDLEPALSEGAVTGIRRDREGDASIESSAAIYRGHEGGPAIDRDGNVVAVAALERHGGETSKMLVPVEAVRRELVSISIPANVDGAFGESYRAALDAAATGNWREARKQLADANRFFPDSPDVIRLTTAADRALSAMPWWRARPAAAAAVLLGILALVSMISLALARTRRDTRDPLLTATTQPGGAQAPLGRLTILNGERAGERLGLGGGGIRIGREAAMCEIVLENPKVSRVHAEILVVGGRVMLVDNNSSNGTYVNDSKIDRRILEDGDIIYFGGRNAVAVAYHA